MALAERTWERVGERKRARLIESAVIGVNLELKSLWKCSSQQTTTYAHNYNGYFMFTLVILY